MRHVGEASELPFEAVEVRGSSVHECLQCDDFIANAVVHFVDRAHASRADVPDDAKSLGAGEVFLGQRRRPQQLRRAVKKGASCSWAEQEPHELRRQSRIGRACVIHVGSTGGRAPSSASSKTARRRRCRCGVRLIPWADLRRARLATSTNGSRIYCCATALQGTTPMAQTPRHA